MHNRLEWLSHASTEIGTTLDLERTAQELADFVVPRLADGAAIDLLESALRGEHVQAGGAGERPVMRAIAVSAVPDLMELEPDPVGELTSVNKDTVAVHALMSRQPVLMSRLTRDDFARVAPTARGAEKMREAGVHSYMVVPLIARGVLLGVADFVRRRSPERISRSPCNWPPGPPSSSTTRACTSGSGNMSSASSATSCRAPPRRRPGSTCAPTTPRPRTRAASAATGTT
jgi:hypothetical protein